MRKQYKVKIRATTLFFSAGSTIRNTDALDRLEFGTLAPECITARLQ